MAEGRRVAIIVHELAHFLGRKRHGVYDLSYLTPSAHGGRITEAGVAAEEKIMGLAVYWDRVDIRTQRGG